MAKRKTKEPERHDISLDGNTASWSLNLEGAINGLYTGTFKFRCFLTPSQQIAADREKREMIGDVNPLLVPSHLDFAAYALAQLKYRVISAPPFWTSTIQETNLAGDLPDENIITAVLDAAVGAEIKYRNHLERRKTDAIERAKKAAEKMFKDQREEDESESEESTDLP